MSAIIAFGEPMFYGYVMPMPDSKARNADGALITVRREGRTIACHARGSGPRVLLLPSAGREASDFNELTAELVEGGYRTLAVEAPGIGGTDMIVEGADLYTLSDDVMAVLDADCADAPDCHASIIGHAFGNLVARARQLRATLSGYLALC